MAFLAGIFIGFMIGLVVAGLLREAATPDPKREILDGYETH